MAALDALPNSPIASALPFIIFSAAWPLPASASAPALAICSLGCLAIAGNPRLALLPLVRQIDALDEAIEAIDRELEASAKADETARRLMTIPGVGPVTAMALLATIQNFGAFSSGREFAAFLGLTPREHSSGGKPRLGRITKMGDRYLRKLLV